ncbi:TPR-like protein [Auricularia subglabra TFB-10046 SS5]|nr:TPR-like protein [Auricularia subglabra TFB-10046 SS5]
MATTTEGGKTKDRVQRALDTTISTINFAKELVPVEIAKTALTSMATLLSVVRDTMKNKEDFVELADECHEIVLIIWDLSKEDGQLDPILIKAIEGVKSTIDRIRIEINEKATRGIASKVFAISADKEDISVWKEDLKKCLGVFNTRLNISANLNLAKLADDLNELRLGRTQAQNPPLRQPIPAKPTLFFGRDALLAEVAQTLLRPSHVALIGTGGIGKTSLAKATLAYGAIVDEFHDERYFVSFEDLDRESSLPTITLETLVGRLASALGLRSSKADLQKLVIWKLQSLHALLVIDNAETILERDSGLIMPFLEEIGNIPLVTMLITTRSAALPLNLWTVEDLAQAWKKEKTRVLQTHAGRDAGKNQNLAVSIELTLRSRAFQDVSPTALHVLQVVAFFPAGINKRKTTELFPGVQNVHSVVGTLCKLSLAQYDGDFLTMLAPIRFHILSSHDESLGEIPLLADVRRYYHSHLKRYGDVRPDEKPDISGVTSWFSGDDQNAEYIVAFDFTSALRSDSISRVISCYPFCHFVLSHLLWTAPRRSSLEVLLRDMPRPVPRRVLGVNVGPLSRTNRLLAALSMGFFLRGELACATGAFHNALEFFGSSAEICRELRIKFGLMRATKETGEVYMMLGNFSQAEASFKAALAMTRKARDRIGEAYITLSLSMLTAFRGGNATQTANSARKLLASMERTELFLPRAIDVQAYAALYSGDYTAAKTFAQELVDMAVHAGDGHGQVEGNMGLAEVALRESRPEDAVAHLDKARELALSYADLSMASVSLSMRASIAAESGDLATAREQMAHALELCPPLGADPGFSWSTVLYLSARVELLGGGHSEARRLFQQCLGLFDAQSDVRFKARTLRALGEVNLVEGQIEAAAALFKETSTLCGVMGIEPRFFMADG